MFKNVVMTPDEVNVVCYGFEKLKNHIYIHAAKNGEFLHKILVKYTGHFESKHPYRLQIVHAFSRHVCPD